MTENREFSNAEAARRGSDAQRILESDVLADALDGAKAEMVKDWLASPNADVQRACWAKIHALDEVRRALRRIMEDGQVARSAIDAAQ